MPPRARFEIGGIESGVVVESAFGGTETDSTPSADANEPPETGTIVVVAEEASRPAEVGLATRAPRAGPRGPDGPLPAPPQPARRRSAAAASRRAVIARSQRRRRPAAAPDTPSRRGSPPATRTPGRRPRRAPRAR